MYSVSIAGYLVRRSALGPSVFPRIVRQNGINIYPIFEPHKIVDYTGFDGIDTTCIKYTDLWWWMV